MKMTKKNYIGISLMVMYGIQLSIDISESKPLIERIIGSLLTLMFVYITANSLQDKDN